jgi:spore maturation protein CgeB
LARKFRIAYLAHSLRSDWNNGNAHFLRGLLSEMQQLGHDVTVFEPAEEWSITNLREEGRGVRSLQEFAATYPNLRIHLYDLAKITDIAAWRAALQDVEIVIVHEWNPPALATMLLSLRPDLRFRILFHDTHHRASSSPEQIRLFDVGRFDGVLVFGEVLKRIYRDRYGMENVWTLHEAADTSVFRPLPYTRKLSDVVWVGNWGDDERSGEIKEFLLIPATRLGDLRFCIYGVRYPEQGLRALREAGVQYGGYLPNLEAPAAYAAARLTVHVPRQQYATMMTGIPTIRVFEALACGIPLISAPWKDTEGLFREGDYLTVRNAEEMRRSMEFLLSNPKCAEAQALRGLETILERHTCRHRAQDLSTILEESFA